MAMNVQNNYGSDRVSPSCISHWQFHAQNYSVFVKVASCSETSRRTVCRELYWVPWLDRTTSLESTASSLCSTNSDCHSLWDLSTALYRPR